MNINYVLGFIFNFDLTEVLLLKKNRKQFAGKLNGIGGKQEAGETELEAMIRETKEETGLEGLNWVRVCLLKTNNGNICVFATSTDRVYNFKQIEDEPLAMYSLSGRTSFYGVNAEPYRNFERMFNLDWLLPMSVNAIQKLDSAVNFVIQEEYE